MSDSETEIGREETKQRKALNAEFLFALKQRAKGTAWRVSKGVLFRNYDGWFVSAPASVWIGRRKTRIELMGKPMPLDPVFWEIVETESNATMPLSFRHHGAWTCRTPAIKEHDLDETSHDPAKLATEAIAWLDDQVAELTSWTPRHFLHLLQEHPRSNSYLATIVTTMLLLDDWATAESICLNAISRGDHCGFSIGREVGSSQSFPELALLWLRRKRGAFH